MSGDALYKYTLREFAYDENCVNLTDWMDTSSVISLRRDYADDSIGLAKMLFSDLINNCFTLSSVIVFCNKRPGKPLFIPNGIKGRYNKETEHAVVLMGEFIFDVLNFDRIIKTKDYIDILEKKNPMLDIVKSESFWWSVRGEKITPSLDYLRNYKFKQVTE